MDLFKKNTKQNTALISFLALFFIFQVGFTGCAKKLIYGKNFYTTPVYKYYTADKKIAFDSVHEMLKDMGYQILRRDPERGQIITGWRPTGADSHYIEVFDRKDYGIADGAYYQVIVDIADSGLETKVAISTQVKSIAGPLESSGIIENKVLKELENVFRAPKIELTNIGVENRAD
jgi:hypothetical protein